MLLDRTISESWIVALFFLLIIVVFGVIKRISPSKVEAVCVSFFSIRAFNQHIKEEFFIKNYSVLFLTITTSFSLAICLALLGGGDIVFQSTRINVFLLFFSALKVGSIYLFSKIISQRSGRLKPIYTLEILFLISAGITAMLFLPIELFHSFSSVKWCFFGLLLALYVLKIGKQLLYSVEHKITLFYIILYFCAFEIIPALTLLKLLELI